MALVTLSCALVALSIFCSPVLAQEPASLEQLKNRTGWILLGSENPAIRIWRTAETFAVDEKSSQWPSTPVPKVGATIRIVSDLPVVILDFSESGEAARERSPASRILRQSDLTGIVLKPGTKVKVRAIRYEEQYGTIRGVWARVEAIPGR